MSSIYQQESAVAPEMFIMAMHMLMSISLHLCTYKIRVYYEIFFARHDLEAVLQVISSTLRSV